MRRVQVTRNGEKYGNKKTKQPVRQKILNEAVYSKLLVYNGERLQVTLVKIIRMHKQQHDHRSKKPKPEFLTRKKPDGGWHEGCVCTLNIGNKLR